MTPSVCSLNSPHFRLENSWTHSLLIVIVIVFILIVVYSIRWRFTLMMSPEKLSMFSPGLRSDDPKFQLSTLKKKRVVFATMLRDTAERVPSIRKRATMAMNAFADARLLVVENDSEDGTRELLLQWAREDPRVTVLGCGVNVKECHLKLEKTQRCKIGRVRIQKMVTLRNMYLEHVKKHYSDWDHLIVWDMDIVGGVYLDALDASVARFDEDRSLDALCARGVYEFGPVPVYYDTYAHADEEDLDGDEGLKLSSHVKLQSLGVRAPDGDEPFEVKTCFSGFTIYRTQSIMNSEYRLSRDDEKLKCEHTTFHEKLQKIKLDPTLKHLVLVNV